MTNLEQGSQAWHEWRGMGVGASEIGAVLGISPFKTAHQLYLEKTNQAEGFKGNAATRRGSDMEDEARKAYMVQSGNAVLTENTCMIHPEHSAIRASLDGWIDQETILEIKCPLEKNYHAMKDGIPEHYRMQMQQQMLVSGAKCCKFWVYHPDFGGYSTTVGANTHDFDSIIEAILDFWNKVEMFTWQSSGVDEGIDTLAALKNVEQEAIAARKEHEAGLIAAMQAEGISNARTSHAKVSLVNRQVVDKEACALNAEWVVASKMANEGKADMADIEKNYKKDGASYIKLTAV